MATKIIMPQGGQHIEEGRVVKWLKNEGEPVKKGEPVCEVETEKVVFEVEAPADGVLLKIVVPAGEKTAIFAVIGIIGEPGETLDLEQFLAGEETGEKAVDVAEIRARLQGRDASGSRRIKASGRARKLAAREGIDLAAVEGTGPGGRIVEEDVLRAVKKPEEEGTPAAAGKVSPLARKIAEEKGLDLGAVTGTGPGGRIVKADVMTALERGGAKPAAHVKPADELRRVREVIPIRGIRQVIFERMHRSLAETAQLTISTEIDASGMMRFRQALNRRQPEEGSQQVSYNAILVKSLAHALRDYPAMNASVVGDEMWLWDSVNVGVAVDTEQGLIVPVIRDADGKDLREIQAAMDDLIERVRNRKLIPDDLQGGTFTLTNLGFLDVDVFTPILNPPETGILGVGRIVEKPVIEEGTVQAGQRMVLSLSFDHRIVDGAYAARFLKDVRTLLEEPYLLAAGHTMHPRGAQTP